MTEAKGVIASVSTNPIKVIKALSQAYQIPDALPWSQIAGPLAAAEDSVARLDERLAKSPIRDGWAARTHFTEACATLWLEGELVHLDDLVLHDAGMDIRTPTHELTRAHAVLRTRRRIAEAKPEWALSAAGLAGLRGRGGQGDREAERGNRNEDEDEARGPEDKDSDADTDEAFRAAPTDDRLADVFAAVDAAIAQAKSQIAEAVATEVEAKAALDRSASLKEKGFAADATLDQRRSAADAATARRAAAEQGLAAAEADKALTEAQRRELELRLAKTEIKAPTAGIVLARNARIGAVVSGAGEPLFRIAEDGAVELEAEVPETALARIAVGQTAAIHVAGSSAVIPGTVRLVAPRIDAASRLGRVRIALPADAAVNVGAFARATIEIARHDGVALPQSAVVTIAGKPTAQVVVNGRIETRNLETGISGEGLVEVRSGVKEGEEVVLRAGTFVRDGDQVTPVAAKEGVSDGASGEPAAANSTAAEAEGVKG